MRPKDADGMTNRVDPDQTAPEEQSDQGLHRLFKSVCPNTLTFYGSCFTDFSGSVNC